MGIEGAPKQNSGPKADDESAIMSRRNFLKFAGAAVVSGVARGNAVEAVSHLVEAGEVIPSERELIETFNILRGERSCRERRKADDEKGVYLWELEFQIEGGTAEFGYMREGKHAVGGSTSKTKIFITYFDQDGMPEGGTDVAEFKEGKWEIDREFLATICTGPRFLDTNLVTRIVARCG